MEPISEAIIGDSSLRFPDKTFIRRMDRIMQRVVANGWPTTGEIRNLDSPFKYWGLD
jgi:hypothetical protein